MSLVYMCRAGDSEFVLHIRGKIENTTKVNPESCWKCNYYSFLKVSLIHSVILRFWIGILYPSVSLLLKYCTRFNTHTHARARAHTHPYAHMGTRAQTHARTHACIHARTRTNTRTRTHTGTHTRTHIHTHAHTRTILTSKLSQHTYTVAWRWISSGILVTLWMRFTHAYIRRPYKIRETYYIINTLYSYHVI